MLAMVGWIVFPVLTQWSCSLILGTCWYVTLHGKGIYQMWLNWGLWDGRLSRIIWMGWGNHKGPYKKAEWSESEDLTIKIKSEPMVVSDLMMRMLHLVKEEITSQVMKIDMRSWKMQLLGPLQGVALISSWPRWIHFRLLISKTIR